MKSDRYEYHRFSGGCPVRLEEGDRDNEVWAERVMSLSVGLLIAGATYIFFFL